MVDVELRLQTWRSFKDRPQRKYRGNEDVRYITERLLHLFTRVLQLCAPGRRGEVWKYPARWRRAVTTTRNSKLIAKVQVRGSITKDRGLKDNAEEQE